MKQLKKPAWGGRGKGYSWYLTILFFLALFLAAQLAESVVIVGVDLLRALLGRGNSADLSMVTALFATAIGTGSALLFCYLAEGRYPQDLGLSPRRAGAEYLVGIPIGLALFSAAIGMAAGIGAVRILPADTVNVPLLCLYGVGFLIQGMSEEVLCRGVLMGSLLRRCPIWVSVVTNSAVFSLLHLANNGVAPLALLNVFLFGVLASLYVIRRGSLWGACAIHSVWNFAQGNLFGASVSGNSTGPSPLNTEQIAEKALWNGGAFGPEGGLCVTAVLLIGIAVLLFLVPNAKRAEDQID